MPLQSLFKLNKSKSILIFMCIYFIYKYLRFESFKKFCKKSMFVIQYIPFLRQYIDKKKDAAKNDIRNSILEKDPNYKSIIKLPNSGISNQQILEIVPQPKDLENLSGTIYKIKNSDRRALISEVISRTLYTNPLHPDTFPLIRKMEGEIISMVGNLFHMPPDGGGVTTTGGTESIILACRAFTSNKYYPEVIVAETAHAAFDKAADLIKFKLVKVKVDLNTFQICLDDLKRKINWNTALIVASMPNYPQGIIDPIPQIASLCHKKNIPLHVDSCLGGFLVPFLPQIGYDFRIKGISSISIDPHKYGCTPKGISVLLYRDKIMRQRQYFIYPNWTGGMYATPTIPGSRTGCIIAAAWATLVNIGFEEYKNIAEKIVQSTNIIYQELSKIELIQILGQPRLNIVAFKTKNRSIFALNDLMIERGWSLNVLQNPDSLHICITGTNYKKTTKFIDDIKSSIKDLLNLPLDYKLGASAIYGMANGISDKTLIKDVVGCFLDTILSPPLTISK